MGEKQSKAAADGTSAVSTANGASPEDATAGAAVVTPADVPKHEGAPREEAATDSAVTAKETAGADSEGMLQPAAVPAVLPSESEILAALVSSLGGQPERCMSISSIREQVPPGLRHYAPDNEGIIQWVRNFPGLLEISGEPGQEVVTLMLGGRPAVGATTSAGASTPGGAAAPLAQIATGVSGGQTSSTYSGSETVAVASAPAPDVALSTLQVQGGAVASTNGDDDGMNPCTVQLRGLPFRATVADIRAFLNGHAQHLVTGEPPIRLLLNRDGRPSGFARVQFVSPEAAKAAREELHKQKMNDRYIEVLACSERAGKARHRRAAAADGGLDAAEGGGLGEVADGASEAIERERVLQECRDHMCTPGRNHLLLSMLGIALSPPARAYLRRQNLGLKHFLARFPSEFRVEGPKGCEKVIWTPNYMGLHPGMTIDSTGGAPNPMAMAAAAGALLNPNLLAGFPGVDTALQPSWTQPAGEAPQPSTPRGMASPTVQKSTMASACPATPSDWGTPGIGLQQAPATNQGGPSAQGGPTSQVDMGAAANWYWAAPWGQAWAPWMQDPNAGADAAAAKVADKANRMAAKRAGAKSDAPAARSHAHLHPQSHPFAHRAPETNKIAAGNTEAAGTGSEKPAEAEETQKNTSIPSLRLRGLPFSMSVQDVFAFFAQYDVADRIVDGTNAAQLLPKANGRPSGQAVVQMRSRYDAEVAQQALHNKWIGGRYIEVFVYGDETPEQAESLNSQLGYPVGQTPVQLQLPEQQGTTASGAGGVAGAADMSGAPWRPQFPNFPGFPGGFPGAPVGPVGGAPPWLLNMPPPAVPGGGTGGLDATEPGAQGDDTWNKLFSFLYSEDGSSALAAEGAPAMAANSMTSPFGPPPALPPHVVAGAGAGMEATSSIPTPARATLQV
mmetsp:Transcript_1071/g.1945  ORF Transcript_1071/g.1945 Transcript_1071/m.1945 type:complete len:904 (+) Transcript_1071:82-2793(+)